MIGQPARISELPPARPVGPDKIGVAEIALGRGAILLPPTPQVAAGETQEHRTAPSLNALTLQRQESLFDRVTHAGA